MTRANQTSDPLDLEGAFSDCIVEHKVFSGNTARMAELLYPAGHYSFEPLPEFCLSRTLRIERPGRLETLAGRRQFQTYRAGDLELTAPHTADHWTTDGSTHVIHLTVPMQVVGDLIEGGGRSFVGAFDRLHEATFRNSATLAIFDQLWAVFRPGVQATHLVTEGLIMALIGQLSLLACGNTSVRPRANGALPTSVIRRLRDYIEETEDDLLRTADLAALADMPLSTFNRRFKATTGLSPHQYVVTLRLERAQHLLGDRRLSLAEIAIRAGFASQSHMTDAFRNKLGSTPAKMRRIREIAQKHDRNPEMASETRNTSPLTLPNSGATQELALERSQR